MSKRSINVQRCTVLYSHMLIVFVVLNTPSYHFYEGQHTKRILMRSRQHVKEWTKNTFSALWRLFLCVVSSAVKMINFDLKWQNTVRLAFPGFYRRRNRPHCSIFCRPLLRAKQVRGEQRRNSFIFCQTQTDEENSTEALRKHSFDSLWLSSFSLNLFQIETDRFFVPNHIPLGMPK